MNGGTSTHDSREQYPQGKSFRPHPASEETKPSPNLEGIETQATNSNQLSVHSIYSRLSLPGAGIIGLVCRIDFRTTESGSGSTPSQDSKQVPAFLGTGVSDPQGDRWVAETPPWRPLSCQCHSWGSSTHKIKFSATIIENVILSLLSSHYRIFKRYKNAYAWNRSEL